MTRRAIVAPLVAPLVAIVLLAWSASNDARGAANKEKAADKPAETAAVREKDAGKAKVDAKGKDTSKEKDKGKTPDKDAKKKEEEKPACMHCGATCGLAAVCVCEPGTKMRPKTEFEVKCEPICVAGCGSKPWHLHRCRDRATCTSCCEEPCECPSRVRSCKRLRLETVDEEVPTVVRKVKYVCDCCAGRCAAGCCGGRRRHTWVPAWWTDRTWWWPRKPPG
jgi:hypothetical protein